MFAVVLPFNCIQPQSTFDLKHATTCCPRISEVVLQL